MFGLDFLLEASVAVVFCIDFGVLQLAGHLQLIMIFSSHYAKLS